MRLVDTLGILMTGLKLINEARDVLNTMTKKESRTEFSISRKSNHSRGTWNYHGKIFLSLNWQFFSDLCWLLKFEMNSPPEIEYGMNTQPYNRNRIVNTIYLPD